MSRSYKKNAIITDNGNRHKYYKRASHRVTRVKVRQVLTSAIDYDEMLFPSSKANELVNQYDICDYKLSYSSIPLVYYSRKKESLVIEYPTAADLRMYKNK